MTIFSYGDKEAIQDGMLVPLDKFITVSDLPKTPDGRPVNRVTRAVFDEFAKEQKGMYLINFSERKLEPSYDLSDVVAAINAVLMDETEDGRMYIGKYKKRTLWLMENEVGGMTLMFPEDY